MVMLQMKLVIAAISSNSEVWVPRDDKPHYVAALIIPSGESEQSKYTLVQKACCKPNAVYKISTNLPV